MTDPIATLTSRGLIEVLDSTRILLDLQRGNEIAQSLAGWLEPEEIAHRVTTGIVEKFECTFARIWLLEPEQTALRLVASSGMYTNLNGRFARVPLGAYKVGKIAQNRVAFLSNNLSNESWVGDREWAIANHIRGFAGYPLIARDRVIGVLAAFSQQVMAPEFLEVLQMLCSMSAIALDTAVHYQKEIQTQQSIRTLASNPLLSDQLVHILHSTRLTLVGTERSLPPSVAFIFVQTAEVLHQLGCIYGRLIYAESLIVLEAIVPLDPASETDLHSGLNSLGLVVSCLGGKLDAQIQTDQRAIQVILEVPDLPPPASASVSIRCTAPILQVAMAQLAKLAGLTVQPDLDAEVPVITDDRTQVQTAKKVLWIQQGKQPPPKGVQAIIDLSTTPEQLQQAVAALLRGELWGISDTSAQPLSERELEILQLLTRGHRDRDIADQLVVSESTVKFHLNNVLTKLKARTRYQAIHQAMVQGWL